MKKTATTGYGKKEVRLIILIGLGFVACLALAKLWGLFLSDYVSRENERESIKGILTRLPMVVVGFYLLKRFGFQRFAGVDHWPNIRQVQIIVIPLFIISMGFFSSLQVYRNAGIWMLSLFTLNTLLVALAEELTFRGLILPLLIRFYRRKKSFLFLSVLVASGIFGVMHYLNLFREPDNFWGITSQVFFAVSIGVLLGGLMLRTRHIVFPVLIHFFVNFSFGNGDLKEQVQEVVKTEPSGSAFDFGTVITLLFFAFMIAGGGYMIRQADKAYVLETMNITDY